MHSATITFNNLQCITIDASLTDIPGKDYALVGKSPSSIRPAPHLKEPDYVMIFALDDLTVHPRVLRIGRDHDESERAALLPETIQGWEIALFTAPGWKSETGLFLPAPERPSV